MVWRSPLLFLSTECQRVHAHLLDHCHQAVRAGRAEMLFQADLFNEVKIGIQYFLRGVVGQDADQQRDDPFDDYRIALAFEQDLAIYVIRLQPNTALATFDQVAFRLILFLQRGKRVTQVYQ